MIKRDVLYGTGSHWRVSWQHWSSWMCGPGSWQSTTNLSGHSLPRLHVSEHRLCWHWRQPLPEGSFCWCLSLLFFVRWSSSQRKVSLGTAPVTISPFPSERWQHQLQKGEMSHTRMLNFILTHRLAAGEVGAAGSSLEGLVISKGGGNHGKLATVHHPAPATLIVSGELQYLPTGKVGGCR